MVSPSSLLLLALVAITRLVLMEAVHIYDDAFITLRYARNLASGLGFVYNPGAEWEPVLGTTTPGFTVLLAGLIRLGLSGVTAVLLLNTLCDVVSAMLLLLLLRKRPAAAFLTVLGFACMPELVRISMGGMEAPLLLTLTLAAALGAERGRWLTAGVFCSLACTIRPEAVLLVGVLALEARFERERLGRLVLPVVLIGALYSWLLVLRFGSPIPHSVISKASRHSLSSFWSTWSEIGRQAFLPRVIYLPLLILALRGLPRLVSADSPLRVPARFGLGIVLAYLVARPHTWGWYYYLPLLAWISSIAFALEGLCATMFRIPRRLDFSSRMWNSPRVAVVVLVLQLAAGVAWFGGLLNDQVTERVYRPLESWALETGLGGATILSSDIGALGWFGDARVLDSEGLTWPEAVGLHGNQVPLIRRYVPDYVMVTAVQGKLGPLRASEEFQREYYPIRRFSARGHQDLDPDLDELPDTWIQDYLIYRRRL